LSFNVLFFVDLGSQHVNVSNDSGIDEVDECIVYESTIDGAWVEDGEVSVFNARGMEVRMGESVGMQGHAIDGVSLLTASLDSHTISN
jgi:hypothetical protein